MVRLLRLPHYRDLLGGGDQEREAARGTERKRARGNADEVDRRPRACHGSRVDRYLRNAVMASLEGEPLLGPGSHQDLERLLEAIPRLLRVDAEGTLVEVVLADSGDAEIHSSVGEDVEGRAGLGHVEGMVERKDAGPD